MFYTEYLSNNCITGNTDNFADYLREAFKKKIKV
jgi:uncharacterized iron-regulated protein